MIPATDYLSSVDWLPFVIGSNFTDALDKLEDRLSKIHPEHLGRSTTWSNAVGAAIEHLREVSKSSTDYRDMEGKFHQLSSDYEKVWEQALTNAPNTSHWLKEQFEKTAERDPVDALVALFTRVDEKRVKEKARWLSASDVIGKCQDS